MKSRKWYQFCCSYSFVLLIIFNVIGVASAFEFDNGASQGWTIQGIGDTAQFEIHSPNPFIFSWDDSTQFPGLLDESPHNDPLGNNLGSISAATNNVILPPGFPSEALWFIDFVSPDITSDPQWQDFDGLSLKIRGDSSSSLRWAQVLLNVTRTLNNETLFLIELNHANQPVFHDITTDQQTNALLNPFHWMSLYPRFGDLSTYTINNVRIRIFGQPQSNSEKFNIDNVSPTVGPPAIGIRGKVVAGLAGEAGNYLDFIFESDLKPSPTIDQVLIKFSGSNVKVDSIASLVTATPQIIRDPDLTKKIDDHNVLVSFSGFDPGERARFGLDLDQLSTGTGSPLGGDYAGASVEITLSGLSANCSNPLIAEFIATDALRATAEFSCEFTGIDNDGDGFFSDVDCDDSDASVFPGATEICDSKDNNCNAEIDEGLSFDADGDGHFTLNSCNLPADDCNDSDSTIFPGATEICDNKDNNCNAVIDEGLSFDVDGDLHYSPGSCAVPADDCNDNDGSIFPGATEICDNKDNNCNAEIDEGLSFDADGDGHFTLNSCNLPADDCNDSDSTIFPGATEICDNKDNNCNAVIDEGLSFDVDGDLHYSPGSCAVPADDCNDNDGSVFPGATEICDSKDNNCNAVIDEGLSFDVDGDGHFTLGSCATPADDCDDSSNVIFPGALEICDAIDNNCDNQIDEGLSVDSDNDGHYALGSCLLPADDCNDSDSSIGDCNTPPSDTPVSVTDSGEVVEVIFPNVNDGGDTTITISECDSLQGFFVTQPNTICADIETTATFSGQVEVCINYDDTGMTLAQEQNLNMVRCDDDGSCVVIERSKAVDTEMNIICAWTDHFSNFGVGILADKDSDGTADLLDNCPGVQNFLQRDRDQDGIGDSCDFCPDEMDVTNVCHGKGLELKEGLNLISLPVDSGGLNLTAFALLTAIGDDSVISRIKRFNPVTGLFEEAIYTNGTPSGVDFPLSASEGYFVIMRQDARSFKPLKKGMNVISSPNAAGEINTSAFALLTNLSESMIIPSVQRLNLNTGRFETATYHNGQLEGVNFPVTAKDGYLLFVEALSK